MSIVSAAVGIVLIPAATVLFKRLRGTQTGRHQLIGAALIVAASSVLIALMGLH
jgi:hypothetical protein